MPTAWSSAVAAPREYAPALARPGEVAEDPGQAAPPRRGRPRPDGPGVGLPRRDRAAAPARRASWSTRRCAATSSQLARALDRPSRTCAASTRSSRPASRCWSSTCRPLLALESMMVALQDAARRPTGEACGGPPGRRAARVGLVVLGVVRRCSRLRRRRSRATRRARRRRPAPTSTARRPGADRRPGPALARFYDQQLDWRACRGDSSARTLTVPLDYAPPRRARRSSSPLLKVPAPAAVGRIGSLVVNPGGPGASGIDVRRAGRRRLRPAAARRTSTSSASTRAASAGARRSTA